MASVSAPAHGGKAPSTQNLFSLRRGGRRPPSIGIPRQPELAQAQVIEEIRLLEQAKMHLYIRKFDIDGMGESILNVLRAKYPNCDMQLRNIVEGKTDTKRVLVDGIATHILKRVSLPHTIFLPPTWESLKIRLMFSSVSKISSQVRNVFFENPGVILQQVYPHFNNAMREKLAYVVGENLGVPFTEVLKANEGTFSLHSFVPNKGSARTLDLLKPSNQMKVNLQSLQNMGILDILLENQDRNPGNILVNINSKGEYIFTPIDHALTYQHKSFKIAVSLANLKLPCWTKWSKADEALTDETILLIQKFSSEELLTKIEKNGLVVDDKVRNSIIENVLFLQKTVHLDPAITLNKIYELFIS